MRTKRRKPSRFRFFAFLFLLGMAVYYLFSLPIWKIQEVAVSGAKMLSAEEIRNLAGIPLNENLFLSSFSRSRANLKKISAIKKFHLYRIPPAAVLIKITERKPVAVVILKGKSALIDEEGFILNRNPNLTLNVPGLEELPVISGMGTGEAGNGEKINSKAAGIIKNIIVELSGLLGSRKIQLELGGFEKISFLLDDILRVKIGRDEEVDEKMGVFKKLLPVIDRKWSLVEYVDVRYPDNPVIKYH